MVRTLTTVAVLLAVTSVVMAGAVPAGTYKFTLPSETSVYSATLTDVTAAVMGDANYGDPGVVSMKCWQGAPWWPGAQPSNPASFTTAGFDSSLIGGDFAHGWNVQLDGDGANLYTGPVSMYFELKALGTSTNVYPIMGLNYMPWDNPGYQNAYKTSGDGEAWLTRAGIWGQMGIVGNYGTVTTDATTHAMTNAWSSGGSDADMVDFQPAAGLATNASAFKQIRVQAYYTPVVLAGGTLDTVSNQVSIWSAASQRWVPVSPMSNIRSNSTDPNAKYFVTGDMVNLYAANGAIDNVNGQYSDWSGQINAVSMITSGFNNGDFILKNLQVTQAVYGDTNFSGTIDATDTSSAIINDGAVAPAIAGIPVVAAATLVYDPSTGNVKLQVGTGLMDGYTITSAGGQWLRAPIAILGTKVNSSKSTLAENNPGGADIAAGTVYDFGNMLGTNLTLAQFQAKFATSSKWIKDAVPTNFAFAVVPEPATMGLLILGGLGVIARRRRA